MRAYGTPIDKQNQHEEVEEVEEVPLIAIDCSFVRSSVHQSRSVTHDSLFEDFGIVYTCDVKLGGSAWDEETMSIAAKFLKSRNPCEIHLLCQSGQLHRFFTLVVSTISGVNARS